MCATGSTKSYRVKINVIGYTKAGKSTLILRLLGEPFQNLESTEGIQTQLIYTTFDAKHEVIGPWEEIRLNSEIVVKDFNKQAITLSDNINRSRVATKASKKSIVNPQVTTSHPVKPRQQDCQQETVDPQPSVVKTITTSNEENEAPNTSDSKKSATGIKMDPVTFQQLNKLKERSNREQETEDATECLINLWDHGGQVEFLATHHLFLDADAVNLIVMDITKKLHGEIPSKHQKANTDGVPRTGANFLDYWMQMILQKSESKGINPNVAIILTHLDEVTAPEADDYIAGLINYIKVKPYSKYIEEKSIFQVDNKTGSISEFNQIRKQIFQMATQQKSWGMERPTRWLKLEASINEEAKAEFSRHFHITRLQELALGVWN